MVSLSIRLCIFTDMGPAGFRLERGTPLPVKKFDFPDTKEGRKEVLEAIERLESYIKRHTKK